MGKDGVTSHNRIVADHRSAEPERNSRSDVLRKDGIITTRTVTELTRTTMEAGCMPAKFMHAGEDRTCKQRHAHSDFED